MSDSFSAPGSSAEGESHPASDNRDKTRVRGFLYQLKLMVDRGDSAQGLSLDFEKHLSIVRKLLEKEKNTLHRDGFPT